MSVLASLFAASLLSLAGAMMRSNGMVSRTGHASQQHILKPYSASVDRELLKSAQRQHAMETYGASSMLQQKGLGWFRFLAPDSDTEPSDSNVSLVNVNKSRYCYELHDTRLADAAPKRPLNDTAHPKLTGWSSCLSACHGDTGCEQVVYDNASSLCFSMGNYSFEEFPGHYPKQNYVSARCGDDKEMDKILKVLDEKVAQEKELNVTQKLPVVDPPAQEILPILANTSKEIEMEEAAKEAEIKEAELNQTKELNGTKSWI